MGSNQTGSFRANSVNIKVSDCYDLSCEQSRGSVDLILTDPPYNIAVPDREERSKDDYPRNRYTLTQSRAPWDINFKLSVDLIKEFFTILKDGGTAIIFYDIYKLETLTQLVKRAGFRGTRIIYWVRNNPTPANTKTSYLINSVEVALVCVKGYRPTFNSEYHKGVFHYPSQNRRILKTTHPCVKPINLLKDLIQLHSKEGEIVFDPFVGSGSNAIACMETGRRFIGGDINEDYVSAAAVNYELHKRKFLNSQNNET